MQVQFKRLSETATIPEYKTPGSAGFDLSPDVTEPFTLQPNEVKLVGTGLAFFIQDPRYVGLLTPRSGSGHSKGLILGNSTGVIDSDYQGELKISLWNRSTVPQTINPGDRVAQLLIVPVQQVTLVEVDGFIETQRGTGGYGSTGQ